MATYTQQQTSSSINIPATNAAQVQTSTTKNNNYSLYTDDSIATIKSANSTPEYSISLLLQKLTTFLSNLLPRSHNTTNPPIPTAPNTPGPQGAPTFPHFLLPYTPAPSYSSSSCSSGDESDKEPTQQKRKKHAQKQKRCWVGRPRGAILRPRDRYYARGLCDKHGSKVLFLENMRIHHGVKGEEGERWHAWRCR